MIVLAETRRKHDGVHAVHRCGIRSDVFGDEEVLAAWPYYEDALNLIANAKALPRTPELPQILEILGRELSEAVAGSKTPKEALDIVAKEMQ